MVITGTMMLIMALVGLASAGTAAGVSAYNNAKNIEYQKEANTQNIEFQREVNAQAQYNLEHQHQIEMNDLKEAGLNPILTVTGGSGAGQAYLNAPQVKAPQSDLSGVGTALSGLNHMASSMMMMAMLQQNNEARNATLAAIAKGNNATSAANAALRAQTSLDRQRMKDVFSNWNLTHQASKGKGMVNSACHFPKMTDKEIDELLEAFKY